MNRKKSRAVTLAEVFVAMGILGLVMVAVISFYVEAIAVSAKKDEQSARLRRFHLGLDKMEQMLREGRIVSLTPRTLTFLKLGDPAEIDGFPNYLPQHVQFASAEEGVVMIHGEEKRVILPTKPGENVIFSWHQENPPNAPSEHVLSIALYFSGAEEGRSDLFFHRSINANRY